MKLKSAELASPRLKNGLFFLYRAFNSYHWVDAVLFYMGALEAFFSLDHKGPAKKTVCVRMFNLLNDPNWSLPVVGDLYDVRSRIAHGRLEPGRDSNENIELSGKMEVLVKLCVRKLIAINGFEHYATAPGRNAFLSQFD